MTVVVPVLNGAAYLAELVDAVRDQVCAVPVDLLVIDSGSTDGSLELLHDRAVRTVRIAQQEFGHGRTRNRAMELSETPFVAFLTQDATPAHPGWLAAMLAPFEQPLVAATFGRQVPRPRADLRTARVISEVYGPERCLMRGAEDSTAVFSDVNSCLRRTAWERVPFRDVPYAEDHHLARDLWSKGFAITYVPEGVVVHSNAYTLREHLGRMVDEVGALPPRDHLVRVPWAVRDCLRQIRKDARYGWARSRARLVVDVPWAVVAEAQRSWVAYARDRAPARFTRLAARRSLDRERSDA